MHPEALNFVPLAGAPADANRSVDFELRRTNPFDPFMETIEGPPKLPLQFFHHTCHGTPEVCEFLRRDTASEIKLWKEELPIPKPRK
ncbi:MAG: hypothetical protein OSA48_00670 [Akkermansiaceae bacterium]|nr:hypothetical protein [Akkermansiaceae bacterium]